MPTELAMVETFGAHYVSLHVRVSNQAAIHLYRETLGFQTEKTEQKYYADGEDAFCMKLELSAIREQIREAAARDEPAGEGIDAKKASEEVSDLDGKSGAKEEPAKKEVKVKVGRGLGVGELVERVASKN